MSLIFQFFDNNVYVNYSTSFVSYILMGVGLYMIAKKLQLPNAWVAFIPVVQIYVLGKIIGVLPLRRKIHPNAATRLLTFDIIANACSLLGTLFMSLAFGMFITGAITLPLEEFIDSINMPLFGLSYLFIIPGAVFAVIAFVYRIFAYIRLFKLFDPRNYVLFTVLGVIFPFLAGIFMIIVSKYNPQEYLNTVPQQQQPFQDIYGG